MLFTEMPVFRLFFTILAQKLLILKLNLHILKLATPFLLYLGM